MSIQRQKIASFTFDSALATMHLRIVIEQDISTGIFMSRFPSCFGRNTSGESVVEHRSIAGEVIEFLRREYALGS